MHPDMREGVDDYLTKPLRNRTLLDALTRWLPENAAAGRESSCDDAAPPLGGATALLHEAVIAELETLDPELLTSVLTLYFDQAAGHLSTMQGAAARGDDISVARTAHQLKGTSATVGATLVSHLASELEVAAKTGDLSTADALVDRMRSALAATGTAFSERSAAALT